MTTTAMIHLPESMNYANLDAYLEGGRVSQDTRNLSAIASIVRLDDESIAYRLHATNIVTYYCGDTIEINVGRWVTNTTLDHLNIALRGNGRVIEYEKHRWYLILNDVENLGTGYRLFNGLLFNAPFGIVLDYNEDELEEIDRCDDILLTEIEKYVKLYTTEKIPELLANMQGDCWACSMLVQGTEKTLGDFIGERVHLSQHINEQYLQGSLIVNAYRLYSSYRPNYIPMAIINSATDGKGREVHRLLRKYLKKAMLQGVTQVY